MTTPDLDDKDGQPVPERRHGNRRATDGDSPPPEVVLGYEAFVRFLIARRVRFGAIVSVVTAAVTWVLTAAAAPRDVKQLRAEVRASDSVRELRVNRIESAVQSADVRIQRLENSDTFKMYLLCVLVRRSDPAATPLECGDIIKQRGKP